MKSLLILGRIPAKTECPFLLRCQTWKDGNCTRSAAINAPYLCEIARLFDIERSTSSTEEE